MATYEDHLGMISAVASAMGQPICDEVAFVGGCTTALLLTDDFTKQQVRHTDDVDLIVHVISTAGWHVMVDRLRGRDFGSGWTRTGRFAQCFLTICVWISCRTIQIFWDSRINGMQAHIELRQRWRCRTD